MAFLMSAEIEPPLDVYSYDGLRTFMQEYPIVTYFKCFTLTKLSNILMKMSSVKTVILNRNYFPIAIAK